MDESTAGVPHVRGERSSRNGFTVWMALRPSRQSARVSERRRKVVLSAPALATRAADIIESI